MYLNKKSYKTKRNDYIWLILCVLMKVKCTKLPKNTTKLATFNINYVVTMIYHGAKEQGTDLMQHPRHSIYYHCYHLVWTLD